MRLCTKHVVAGLVLFWFSLSSAFAQETYATTSLEILVFRDGVVRFTHKMQVNETLPALTVSLLTTSVGNILAVDQEGKALSFEVKTNNLTVNTLGATRVTVEYETSEATSKEGRLWSFRFTTPWPAKLTLPEQAVILFINELPLSVASKEGRTILTLEPGSWQIDYMLPLTTPPQTTNPPSTQEPPKTTTTTSTPTTQPPQTPQPPSKPPEVATALPIPVEALGGVLAVVVTLIGVVSWWRRRTSLGKAAVNLRPEDRAVLEYIQSRGGRILEAELRQKFILPKTSGWRLVRRLERMGYVKVTKIGLQNEIELVKGS